MWFAGFERVHWSSPFLLFLLSFPVRPLGIFTKYGWRSRGPGFNCNQMPLIKTSPLLPHRHKSLLSYCDIADNLRPKKHTTAKVSPLEACNTFLWSTLICFISKQVTFAFCKSCWPCFSLDRQQQIDVTDMFAFLIRSYRSEGVLLRLVTPMSQDSKENKQPVYISEAWLPEI